MHTTLIKLKELGPCEEGEIKLLKFLNKKTADDCKLEFSTILEAIGIEDATWCLSVLSLKEVSMFNAKVAEISLSVFEKQYPNDMRIREAIQGSKDYFNGVIEVEDLERLKDAAWDAARDATCNAAKAEARAGAWTAACNATWDAAEAILKAGVRVLVWKKIEIIFKEEFC